MIGRRIRRYSRACALAGLSPLVGCVGPDELDDAQPVTVNEIVEGNLARFGSKLYGFEAKERVTFSVLLQVVSGTATLTLENARGTQRLWTLNRASAGEPLGRHATPEIFAEAGVGFRIRIEGQGLFRFQVYVPQGAPERGTGTIAIGDTIRVEDIHAPTDIDVFTFQGAAGDELIAYVKAIDGQSPGVLRLTITGPGLPGTPAPGLLPWQYSAVSVPGLREFEREASPRFTLPSAGDYRLRVGYTGLVENPYVGPYWLQVRQIQRSPEHVAQATVVGDTTIGEGLEYVGDIDEFTLVGTPSDEYNVLFQGADPNAMVLEIPELNTPANEPLAIESTALDALIWDRGTGRFSLPASGRVTIRVTDPGHQLPEGGPPSPVARGPYRLYALRVDRRPEANPVSLAVGDSVLTERIEVPGDIDEYAVTVPVEDTVNLVVQMDSTSYWARQGLVNVLGARLYRAGSGDPVGATTMPVVPPFWSAASGRFTIPAGEYRLRVMDDNARILGYHGPYGLFLHRIRSAPEGRSGTVAIGDTVTESLDPPGDVDVFVFSGSKGDHIDVQAEVPGTPSPGGWGLWIHVGTDPNPLAGIGIANRTWRITLRETGSYQIRVASGGTLATERGPYRFTIVRLDGQPERHASILTLGELVSDERLDEPGDVDEFIVRGPPGAEIALFLTVAEPAVASLVVEALDRVTKDTIRTTPSFVSTESTGRFLVPPSGELLVRVSEPGPADPYTGYKLVGDYRLEIYPINRAPEHASAQHVLGDTVSAEAIDSDGDIDEFRFSGAAGERIAAYFQTPTGIDGSPPGLVLELLAPGAAEPLASAMSYNPTSNLEDIAAGPVVLPASGEYMIRVRGFDDRDGRGNYRFSTRRLP